MLEELSSTIIRRQFHWWFVFLGLMVWLGWNVGRADLANPYYAAAAATVADSGGAALFGTFDPGDFVTIDKPPASLWAPAAAISLFGLSSWTVVGPSVVLLAMAGAATVSTVAKQSGRVEAWIALSVFAATPVVGVMGQTNLPDIGMVAGMTGAISLILGGFSRSRLILASLLIGLSVLAKPAALLVVPAFVWGAWRLAPNKRLATSSAAVSILLLPVLAWVLAVQAVPESQRPWIGGTSNNRPIEQILGPTGIGRVIGAAQSAEQQAEDADIGELSAGSPGPLRVLTGRMGQQAAWLIVIGLAAALRWRETSKSQERTAIEVWALWLGVHIVAFSANQGVAHAYYALALVPAVAALVGVGAVEVAKSRISWFVVVVVAGLHGVVLVNHTSWFYGWLTVVLVIGIGLAVLVRLTVGGNGRRFLVSNSLVFLALLTPPVVFSIDAAQVQRQADFDPAAGPLTAGGNFDLGGIEAELPPVEGSRWAIATADAMTASLFIVEEDKSAMLVGGFRGRDPIITASELRALMDAGTVATVLLRPVRSTRADDVLAEAVSGCQRLDTVGGMELVNC